MAELQIEYRELDSLIPYAKNARTHSEEQVLKIAGSIKAFGWTNPILVDGENGVIAGHGRIAAARKLGMSMVPVIELAGMSENDRRAYIITDNRTAELAGWDSQMLALELGDLAALDFDIELTGFTLGDLDLMTNGDGEAGESGDDGISEKYTKDIVIPIYEPKNEKPKLGDLYDETKLTELRTGIQSSGITDDEKAFLISAAERHVVFNFSKIADYYAHSSVEMQGLMEKTALVIIDFDKAIENGFVYMTEQLGELIADEG